MLIKKYSKFFKIPVLLIFLITIIFSEKQIPIAQAQVGEQLLQPTDFTYVGSFKLPTGNFGSDTFDYSGVYTGGVVYNDLTNGKTLFVSGLQAALQVSTTVSWAQVKIPALKDANSVGINGLNTATVVQGFSDPSGGKGSSALVGNGYGSSIVYNGKFIGTETTAYDANCGQTKSAWVGPLTFSQSSTATGPYAFTEAVTPRIIGGGYMTLIPSEWQSALGGKIVSGNGPSSIISCGSSGPSLHVIDGDQLVTQPAASTKINSSALSYYPDGVHSTLGVWNSNSPTQVVNGKAVPTITVTDPHGRGNFTIPYEDNSMRIQGVLFPEGTSSVIFFGHKGLGPYCYGIGSDCGDQDSPNGKGDHAYPYTEFAWFYNVNDLIAVKNGTKNPWDIAPYTGWAFKVPGDGDGGESVGIAWDASTRLAYMVVSCGYSNCDPVVHVFSVAGSSSTPPPTPPSPSPTPTVGDINLDHIVNSIDYSILNAHWFTNYQPADLNNDGIVNAIDYSMLNANWFKTW